MQRLYSMFPGGWPAIGLIALRTSVAATLFVRFLPLRRSLPGWEIAVEWSIATLLLIGYLTPIAAAASVLWHALNWWRFGGCLSVMAPLLPDALALSLLGPGAFSLDAHLFGRRIVVLPPR